MMARLVCKRRRYKLSPRTEKSGVRRAKKWRFPWSRKPPLVRMRENVFGLHHTRSVGIEVAAYGFSGLPSEPSWQGANFWLTAINLFC
jgi:hypothetical protein